MTRPSIQTCATHDLPRLQAALLGVDRRTLIFAAGVLNNLRIGRNLGSQEFSVWMEGRRAVDPRATNPYWRDK